MRRLVSGFVLGGVLLSGCDKFAARSDVAALVGAHELSAARVAEIKGVTQPELAALTTDNFFRLFDRAARPA